jgi:taurine dioxygenase
VKIIANDGNFGARIEAADLSIPLDSNTIRTILGALGTHGVLCFPEQDLAPSELAAFGACFGELEINVADAFQTPQCPEVMTLSNMVREDGRPLGLKDAGQGWHTDMSYSHDVALANVLHARQTPSRDGRSLGDTQFLNMHAAYDDLPEVVKTQLEGRTAIHDFDKFWEMMRARPGSTRPPLSPVQRRKKPPVSQPLFRLHPITGRRVLYCNPGYTMRIEDMAPADSDAMLNFLFEHQSQSKYLYAHHWTNRDILMWDNIGTTHNAVSDYEAHEHRLIHRVQVMATLDYTALLG